MKVYLSGLATGIILAIASLLIYLQLTKIDNPKIDVVTTNISGEDIIISDVKMKKNKLEFKTEAKGKGTNKVEITIPYKKHCLQGAFLYDYKPRFMMNYLYSIDRNISLGGGVIISKDKFEGIAAVAQIRL